MPLTQADNCLFIIRIPVYKSEHCIDNHNPFFRPVTIGLEELCYCDLKWPLMITVMDWQRNGKHREIGSLETTVAELVSRVTRGGNADREQALPIDPDIKGGNSGLIVVISAKVVMKK